MATATTPPISCLVTRSEGEPVKKMDMRDESECDSMTAEIRRNTPRTAIARPMYLRAGAALPIKDFSFPATYYRTFLKLSDQP
jgi:hypothetical protein